MRAVKKTENKDGDSELNTFIEIIIRINNNKKEMKTATNGPAQTHVANLQTMEEALRYRRAREQKDTHPLMAFRTQTTCMKKLIIKKTHKNE